MARNFTVGALLQRVRERADMIEGNPRKFCGDDEIIRWLSQSYTKLYGIIARSGLNAFESEKVYVTDGRDPAAYPLPADFFGCLRVDWLITATAPIRYLEIRELMIGEAGRINWSSGGRAIGFRIVNETLVLYPNATTVGQSYLLVYIPTAADLTDEAQPVNGVNGFEEIMVLDASIRALQKEETDASPLIRERTLEMARCAEECELRMARHNRRVEERPEGWDDGLFDEGDWRWYR